MTQTRINTIPGSFLLHISKMFALAMLSNIFRAQSNLTNDDIDPWDLPRLHRAVYCKRLDKMSRLLRLREINVNDVDRQGR